MFLPNPGAPKETLHKSRRRCLVATDEVEYDLSNTR